MTHQTRWAVTTTGDIADIATGEIIWFKTGVPTAGRPQLVAAAPEILDSLREAVMHMQFRGKEEGPLTDQERQWLNTAAALLNRVEGERQ